MERRRREDPVKANHEETSMALGRRKPKSTAIKKQKGAKKRILLDGTTYENAGGQKIGKSTNDDEGGKRY